MNDAQIWTVIGGFLAILMAMSGLVLRVVQVQMNSINVRMDGLEARLLDKIGGLDRDVQLLVEDKFKGPRP